MQTVPISILREKRTGDGAGGKEVILRSVRVGGRFTWDATITRRNTTGYEERLEEGKRNSTGPGVQEVTRRIFCFQAPYPKLLRDDRLVDPDGVIYTVHHLRPYGWTLQVDGEVVT